MEGAIVLRVALAILARKWWVMATPHTALHSRLAICCSRGLQKMAHLSRLFTFA